MNSAARVSLVCPVCGGALPPDALDQPTRCEYCGQTSVPVPRAVAPIDVKVEYVLRPGEDPATVLGCPCCKAPLFAITSEDVTLHGCGVCGGIWIDNAGSQSIVRRSHPGVVALAERAAANAKVHLDPAAARPRPPLTCPECHAQMARVRPGNVAELDVCAAHGTWFDAGELTRIASIAGKHEMDARLAGFADAAASMQRPEVDTGALFARGALLGLEVLSAILTPQRRI
ncbi:MAG: hypothetical protein NVSMB47_06040 [Polyangiales bacterium]